MLSAADEGVCRFKYIFLNVEMVGIYGERILILDFERMYLIIPNNCYLRLLF